MRFALVGFLALAMSFASAAEEFYGGDSDNIDTLIAAACKPGAGRAVTLGRNPHRVDGTWMITRTIVGARQTCPGRR